MNLDRREPIQADRSPWSSHSDKSRARIGTPQRPVDATIVLSGSKSLTNRALIIAALAEGTSRIEGILRSDDAYWCLDCLAKLGVQASVDGETVVVRGCGGSWPNRTGDLFVGAAGTIARFLPGALAIGKGEWNLRGTDRLSERPLAPLLDALTGLGAGFSYAQEERKLPFTLKAAGLRGGETAVPGTTSSQFISGLLIAAPYAEAPLTVRMGSDVVQRDYVEMTLDMMRAFGAAPALSDDGQSVFVPTGRYRAGSIRLEPDVSACCYFWALAALAGGRIRIDGIDAAVTRQPDIEMLHALERMGCTVLRGDGYVEVRGAKRLRGGFTISMRSWSDQTLTLAALAPFADGPITLTDAAHIRHHECDRLAAVCKELRKLGVRVDEFPDGVTVYPGDPVPALVDSHDDHRMAMALSLIGARIDGVRIADPGCVSKTCPDFFERLSALGVQVDYDS